MRTSRSLYFGLGWVPLLGSWIDILTQTSQDTTDITVGLTFSALHAFWHEENIPHPVWRKESQIQGFSDMVNPIFDNFSNPIHFNIYRPMYHPMLSVLLFFKEIKVQNSKTFLVF
jgi:hypothetical protein